MTPLATEGTRRIGPGRFNKDGKSAIKALWIDKIEFVKAK